MIKRSDMQKIASEYSEPKIAVLGSHSALEIMDGAKDEEFSTQTLIISLSIEDRD